MAEQQAKKPRKPPKFPSARQKETIRRWLKSVDFKSAYGHDPKLCRAVKIVMQALDDKRPGILHR